MNEHLEPVDIEQPEKVWTSSDAVALKGMLLSSDEESCPTTASATPNHLIENSIPRTLRLSQHEEGSTLSGGRAAMGSVPTDDPAHPNLRTCTSRWASTHAFGDKDQYHVDRQDLRIVPTNEKRAHDNDTKPPAVTVEDAKRERSLINGRICLLITEADGILNGRGKVTSGTLVWRHDIKGAKRHRKIPQEKIPEEATAIRRSYSQEIMQNHRAMLEGSNEVQPALMVEEEKCSDGQCLKGSPRYYWRETGKFYRRASNAAIAKAWSAKPYHPKKPEKSLAEVISEYQEEMRVLILKPIADQAFVRKARVVQDTLNSYERDISLWEGSERDVIAVLEKSWESLLKAKQLESSKKRKANEAIGLPIVNQELVTSPPAVFGICSSKVSTFLNTTQHTPNMISIESMTRLRSMKQQKVINETPYAGLQDLVNTKKRRSKPTT